MQTTMIDGRECRKQPIIRFECTVAFRYVETLRSRLARFVKAHIVDADPWDDESHAFVRYSGQKGLHELATKIAGDENHAATRYEDQQR